MRSFRTAVLVLLLLLPSIAFAQSLRAPVEVGVDPRVELLCIVARFAGFEEYDMPNSRSAYATRVEEHFGAQRGHPAVARMVVLRSLSGIGYDAVPSLALHLDGIERLELVAPLEPRPERLDARWQPAATLAFLEELRDFARASRAAHFFEDERDYYAEVERRFAERIAQSSALDWFDRFFGARAQASYRAIPGLLCGGGNYGLGVRLGDGRLESITPIFGCSRWDADGLPVFDEGYLSLFIHELCHSYTNPFVDRHEGRLRAAGERIFASCAERMRSQAYGTWKTMLYESLVRASVVRCRSVLEGEKAGREQAAYEVQRSFLWVPALAELFAAYEVEREQYPDFESFMPRVADFFDAWAKELPDPSASAPVLVSSTPASGAEEVDPSLVLLRFEFDRPMQPDSWSITGSPEEQPRMEGTPSYDAERRTLSVPVRLEPGRSYRLWLNSERFQGFKSAQGVPLAPVEIRFRTAAR